MQTEHHEAPDADYIESQVFRDGKIVLSRRFERRQDEGIGPSEQLRRLHQSLVEKLRAGQLRRQEKGSRNVHDDRNLRKMAIRFFRTVGDRPPESDLQGRLFSVSNMMALVGGQQASRGLRDEDLQELLRFRTETSALLGAANFDHDAARDLWRRLAATAGRLARVNNRKQLIAHDVELARRVLDLFDATRGDEPLRDDEHQELRPLWGRDLELDRLLDEPGGLTVKAVRKTLKRVLESLDGRQNAA